MVISLEQGADLHTAQLMPLPLTVSCFSKIQIGFSFLVLTYSRSPGKKLLNGCVCVVNACFCRVWFSFFPYQAKRDWHGGIGLGKRLRNDLFCVEWDVIPQLNQSINVAV